MSEEVTVQRQSAPGVPAEARSGFWLERLARAFAGTSVPFEMYFPDGRRGASARARRASASR